MTQVTTLPPLTRERAGLGVRHGLRDVLGSAAWNRLPEAVRERFADTTAVATYAGAFEVVRASGLGRMFAWLGTLFGTPVAPRAGHHVAARVRVHPDARGVAWDREYFWDDGSRSLVRSTKVVSDDGQLVEVLPARLCMPLHTFEEGGGISGVAVLAESHISVHTWPEKGFAAFDVFMCGDAEPRKAIEVFKRAFNPGRVVVGEHKRGVV